VAANRIGEQELSCHVTPYGVFELALDQRLDGELPTAARTAERASRGNMTSFYERRFM
jgi:hypothetical protein